MIKKRIEITAEELSINLKEMVASRYRVLLLPANAEGVGGGLGATGAAALPADDFFFAKPRQQPGKPCTHHKLKHMSTPFLAML